MRSTWCLAVPMLPLLAGAAAAQMPPPDADLPPGAVLRLGGAALNTSERVRARAFSADAALLAVGCDDDRIHVFDAVSGRLRWRRRAHGARFAFGYAQHTAALVFSADATTLVSRSMYSRLVFVWDAASGALRRRIDDAPVGHGLLRVTADGGVVAVGEVAWDVATGERVAAPPPGETRSPTEPPRARLRAAEVRSLPAPPPPAGATPEGAAKDVVVVGAVRSPDGERVLGVDRSRRLLAWGLKEDRAVEVLDPGPGPGPRVADAQDVFLDPGGRTLFLLADGHLDAWSLATGKSLRPAGSHRGVVRGLAFSPDGERVVSACEDGHLRVWRAGTGELVADVLAHRGEERSDDGWGGAVTSVAFSPDGARLATGGWDRRVRVWDPTRLERPLLDLEVETWGGVVVGFSPDGARLVAADDHDVFVWDAATGEEQRRLEGAVEPRALAFSPDGRWLVTANRHRQPFTVFDLEAGSVLAALGEEDGYGQGQAVAFSGDGATVYALHATGVVRWKTTEPSAGLELLAGVRGAFGVAGEWTAPLRVLHDGRLVHGGDPAVVRDAATGRELHLLTGHAGPVLALACSPDGRRIATGGADRSVLVWDVSALPAAPARVDDAPRRPERTPPADAARRLATFGGDDPVALALDPAGAHVVAAHGETMQVFEVATGRRVSEGPLERRWTLKYVAHDRLLVALADRLVLIEPTTGRRLGELPGLPEGATSLEVAVAPGGRRAFVAIGAERPVPNGCYAVDVGEDGRLVAGPTLSLGEGVRAVAASSGGLMAVAEHGEVWLRDAGDLGYRRLLEGGDAAGIVEVAFTPDGERLVTADIYGGVHVWSLTPRPSLERTLRAAGGWSVASLAVSPDGRRVAVARDGTAIDVWDLSDGRLLTTLTAPGAVTEVAFTPAGVLVSGGREVLAWDLGFLDD